MGGGGWILPVAILDVNNFFNIKAYTTKLGDFFQNLSGNNLIWHVTAHITWRFHGNHILTGMFSKFQFLLLQKIKTSFLVAIFKSLDRFMVFLFVLITFEPILDGFWRIWTNPETQDGGPRWPPFRTDYPIITSCDVIASWCRRQRRHFQTYYLPSKSRRSFYYGGPPPPLQS